MAKLVWDKIGEHFFTTGVDRGVLYKYDKTLNGYGKGVAWSGLTSVEESPSGAEANAYYADNIKYLNIISNEEFGCTIGAYYYPDEFKSCNGLSEVAAGVTVGQQTRDTFAFAYRTLIGNDTEGTNKGYIIKLVYGCTASPTSQSHSTISDNVEPGELSWEVSTTPIAVEGKKPTATIDIDSTKVDSDKLASFEAILYGSEGTVSYEEVTDTAGKNPSAEGWYERSGSAEPYTYTLSTDTTVDSSKTYYAKVTSGGTDARIPLPDEVARHFGPQG